MLLFYSIRARPGDATQPSRDRPELLTEREAKPWTLLKYLVFPEKKGKLFY